MNPHPLAESVPAMLPSDYGGLVDDIKVLHVLAGAGEGQEP